LSDNENLIEPQLIPPKGTVEESVSAKQCIFYENRNLREVPGDRSANLLIEVQLPKSMNDPGDYVSLGWTFINLFD
jgi:hypothetical protein